jgi:hypothetical protein
MKTKNNSHFLLASVDYASLLYAGTADIMDAPIKEGGDKVWQS